MSGLLTHVIRIAIFIYQKAYPQLIVAVNTYCQYRQLRSLTINQSFIMKNRSFITLSLLSALFLVHQGCTSEPVTTAVSADGVEISFSNQGKGEPAIVLVHGWTNNNTIFDLQVPVLAEKYQVVALDLAGHGKSGNAREEWKTSLFGEDIAAVVNALGLDNVILAGFSMGGPAVLEAAKLLPDKVSGLILLDAVNNPEDQIPPQVIHYIDSVFMDLIRDPTPEKAVALGFVVNDPEGSVEKVKVMIDRDQTGWEDMLLEIFRWSNEDCISAFEAIDVPVVAINTAYMPTAVDVFEKYVPHFSAKILENTGHVMMWDVTEEFNKALLESIEEIIAVE
jgi:pimeloyl-ACP methyl ester carboxylesterase